MVRISTALALLTLATAGQEASCTEDEPQQWEALKEAVVKAGGSIDDKVGVASPSPRLAIRGMRAGRAYQTGEVITSTPHTMLMSNHTAYLSEKDSGFGAALRSMRSDTFTDLDALVFHIMNEKQKGTGSKWAEYLRYMPEAPPQPMFWSSEQIKERFAANKDDFARIYGDEEAFLRDVQNERKVLNANYRAHSELLNVTLEQIGKSRQGAHFDEELYNWAQGMIRSRSLNLPIQSFTMFPVADLFNHGNQHANAEWHMDDVDFGCGPSGCGIIKGAIQTRATHPIAEGDEILVSYGRPEGPAEARTFLAEFGFVHG
jgi:hypothetical protein